MTNWRLRPATTADADWLADLKSIAMRADLERFERWSLPWARQRFLDKYVPANTRVVVHDGRAVGCIAVRAEPDARWIEHFYLDPSVQGAGLGGAVLEAVLAEDPGGPPFRLAVFRGSAARRLYERRGFVFHCDDENGVDEILERPG